jgi:phosphohistidine phosphatase
MELYLLRHGAAEQPSGSGKDSDRQLTPEGLHILRRGVKQARLAGLNPSLILSSPYVRAAQTAQVAARLLRYSGEILQSGSLTPNASPSDLWNELRLHSDHSSILAVTHEPLVSAAACWMLGSTRAMIQFAPGMMVRIDFENPGSEPRGMLRRIFTCK